MWHSGKASWDSAIYSLHEKQNLRQTCLGCIQMHPFKVIMWMNRYIITHKTSLNYWPERISNKAKPNNLCGLWIFSLLTLIINPSVETRVKRIRNTPLIIVYHRERRSPAFNVWLRSMTEETPRRSSNSPSQNDSRYNPSSSLKRLQRDGSIRAPAISTLSSASHINRLEQWRSVEHWRSVRVKRACMCARWFPHCCWQSTCTEKHQHHSTSQHIFHSLITET